MPVTAGQTTPVVRCLDPPATPPRPEIRARALSRRSALRAMVAACGSAVVAGCPATTSGQARPPATRTRTPLSFATLNAGLWSTAGTTLVMQALWSATEGFRAQHPSLELSMQPPFAGGPPAVVTALTAGTAPDVLMSWTAPWFDWAVHRGLFVDLTPYLQQSNRSLEVWPSYAVQAYNVGGRQYALPFYIATTCQVVNLGVLDGLGLSYPAVEMPLADWVRLWEAATSHDPSHPRVGGGLHWTATGLPQATFSGWGGQIMDQADPARCRLDSPECLAAGNALFPLLTEGICQLHGTGGMGWLPALVGGSLVSAVLWNPALAIITQVESLIQLPKWDFFLMPSMPRGNFAYTQHDFRAINAATRYPDAAWELLEWLSFEPDFQRVLMRYGLEPPALTSLQPEYVQTLRQVVPPLQRKNLQAVTHYIRNNGAVPNPFLPVAGVQAEAIMQQGELEIIGRKVGVTAGLTQVAQQVTGLEAAEQDQVAQEARAFQAEQAAERTARRRLPALFAAAGRSGRG